MGQTDKLTESEKRKNRHERNKKGGRKKNNAESERYRARGMRVIQERRENKRRREKGKDKYIEREPLLMTSSELH